jgi:hypothetical protein
VEGSVSRFNTENLGSICSNHPRQLQPTLQGVDCLKLIGKGYAGLIRRLEGRMCVFSPRVPPSVERN